MAELEQLQLVAQLVDNIEISLGKLERAYQNNDSEDFQKARKALLDFQQKNSEVIEKI